MIIKYSINLNVIFYVIKLKLTHTHYIMKIHNLLLLLFCIVLFSCEKENNSPNDNKDSFMESDFPMDEGRDTIWVSNVDELMHTVQSTKEGNKVVIIKDGTYELRDRLWLTGNNLIYRSESENRDKVILKGNGMNGSVGFIFSVTGNNFAVKDLTIGEVKYHGIQVHGEKDADNIYVQNVRFYNIRQQMIKGSFDKNKPENHTDNGIVENCLFEYTAGHSYYYYCGGIDIHHGLNWRVSNCTFKNIYSPENALSEGGIHFWNNSESTLIENNVFINCDRGIMLGFDNSPQKGGIIRNNMLYVTRDVGIYLCNATDVKVYNNSIFIGSDYPNSIEYRFSSTTDCEIINNLTNKNIKKRDNANAFLSNNYTTAQESWFTDAKNGDLHLTSSSTDIIDAAEDLEDVITDIDGNERLTGKSDIGADEK